MVTKYESVKLLKKENYLLVQTDKGQYKAKDTVKFRVLALDHDLRLLLLKSQFITVIACFSDPVRSKVWMLFGLRSCRTRYIRSKFDKYE